MKHGWLETWSQKKIPARATGGKKPLYATAEGISGLPNKLAQRQHHEIADDHGGIVVKLCGGWPVIVCKDRFQWILQRKDAQRAGRVRWTGVRDFRIRNALIDASRAVCAIFDPATLAALPDGFGGAS